MKEKVYRTVEIYDDLYWDSTDDFLKFMQNIAEKYKDKDSLNISLECRESWEYGELDTKALININYQEYETDEEYSNRLTEEATRRKDNLIKSELIKMKIPVTTETIKLYKEGRLK